MLPDPLVVTENQILAKGLMSMGARIFPPVGVPMIFPLNASFVPPPPRPHEIHASDARIGNVGSVDGRFDRSVCGHGGEPTDSIWVLLRSAA